MRSATVVPGLEGGSSLTGCPVWFPETCDCDGHLKGHYVGEYPAAPDAPASPASVSGVLSGPLHWAPGMLS